MVLWGGDFAYDNPMYFRNLEELVMKINSDYSYNGVNIKAKYSTPSQYFAALNEENKTNGKEYKVYLGDFMNYVEREMYLHADKDYWSVHYWTGYYATRPIIKQRHREVSRIFRNAQSLHTLAYAHLKHSMKITRKNFVDPKLSEYMESDELSNVEILPTSREDMDKL
jgi:hypothetical protein